MIISNIAIKGYKFTGMVYRDEMPEELLKGLPAHHTYTVLGHFHLGLQGIYVDYVELCSKDVKPRLISEEYLNYTQVERQVSLLFRGAA
jgi:hypothetical protein